MTGCGSDDRAKSVDVDGAVIAEGLIFGLLAGEQVEDGDLVPIGDLTVDRERLDKAFFMRSSTSLPLWMPLAKIVATLSLSFTFRAIRGPSIVICSFQDTASTATPSGMTTTFASG